jgi:hypothetical protein
MSVFQRTNEPRLVLKPKLCSGTGKAWPKLGCFVTETFFTYYSNELASARLPVPEQGLRVLRNGLWFQITIKGLLVPTYIGTMVTYVTY